MNIHDLNAQRKLALVSTITVFAIALLGIGRDILGGMMLLAGWATMFWCIHKYGRLGPESPPPSKEH